MAELKEDYKLESPVSGNSYLGKNIANRDNQLESHELGWLAGMIEGDGFISVCVYKSPKAKLGCSPKAVLGVTNQDIAIINHVDNLFRRLGVIANIREQTTPKGLPIVLIATSKMAQVKKVADVILPYLIGEKKARAELVLKFLNRRLAKPNSHLDEEDINVLSEMNRRFISRKGKITSFDKILREHTFSPKGMMCSELIGNDKNTAEMTVSTN